MPLHTCQVEATIVILLLLGVFHFRKKLQIPFFQVLQYRETYLLNNHTVLPFNQVSVLHRPPDPFLPMH
jgi:hypothetical protein